MPLEVVGSGGLLMYLVDEDIRCLVVLTHGYNVLAMDGLKDVMIEGKIDCINWVVECFYCIQQISVKL